MRKKVYLAIAAAIVIIGFAFYFYFSIYPEQLEDNIYQQNGYAVHKVEEDTLEFRLDKKWMDVPEGDTKTYNEEVHKGFQSTVYLEKIWNESGSYHFQFNIQHNLKAGSGKFLSQYHITNQGGEVSLVSKGDVIQLYDRHDQVIKPTSGSRGSGPGEIFTSSFDRRVLQSAKEIGLRLRVYEYKKQ